MSFCFWFLKEFVCTNICNCSGPIRVSKSRSRICSQRDIVCNVAKENAWYISDLQFTTFKLPCTQSNIKTVGTTDIHHNACRIWMNVSWGSWPRWLWIRKAMNWTTETTVTLNLCWRSSGSCATDKTGFFRYLTSLIRLGYCNNYHPQHAWLRGLHLVNKRAVRILLRCFIVIEIKTVLCVRAR